MPSKYVMIAHFLSQVAVSLLASFSSCTKEALVSFSTSRRFGALAIRSNCSHSGVVQSDSVDVTCTRGY